MFCDLNDEWAVIGKNKVKIAMNKIKEIDVSNLLFLTITDIKCD